jgi:hypothetical protein
MGRKARRFLAVTERAVAQRVARRLAHDNSELLRLRGAWCVAVAESKQGYYQVRPIADLEAYARRLGVLKPYERMEG